MKWLQLEVPKDNKKIFKLQKKKKKQEDFHHAHVHVTTNHSSLNDRPPVSLTSWPKLFILYFEKQNSAC